MLLVLLLFTSAPVFAQEPQPGTEVVSAWEAEFSRAVESYLEGDLTLARSDFVRLANPQPGIPEERVLEARVYLAEVEYYRGERDAAWRTCLAVLTEDPEYRIDPFVHPPELVAYFDSVRVATARVFPEEPEPNPRIPTAVLALVPGAIQFRNGQTGLGVLTSALVGSLGVSTATLYFNLRSYDQQPDLPGIHVSPSNEQRALELKTWTNITRWSAVGLWSLSVSQGLLRSARAQEGTVHVLPVWFMGTPGVTVLW